MENTSPLRLPRKPVPVNETLPRITSQGYTTVPHTEDHSDDAVVSWTSSGRNFVLEENEKGNVTPERTPPDATPYSDDDNNRKIEQHEIGTDTTNESLQPRSHLQNIRQIVTKFWLWEVAACVFSLITLASIVGILIYEDCKQLDQWAWTIPPTAVVSFIATLAKGSIVLVLSQVLSQLKWLYFREAKSLQYLRIFDQASRGPLGSLAVIWTSKKMLASIAACLMILALLVDPFVQLVFSFPSIQVNDTSQKASFKRIDDWDGELGMFSTMPSLRIWASMYQGFTAMNITPNLTCPSGNCAWSGPIKTLGICGSCSDVTDDVIFNCSTTTSGPVVNRQRMYILTCDYVFNTFRSTLQSHRWTRVNGIMEGFPTGVVLSASRTLWNSTVGSTAAIPVSNLTAYFQHDETRVKFDGQYVAPIGPGSGLASEFLGNSTTDGLQVLDGNLIRFEVIQLPTLNSSDEPVRQPYSAVAMPSPKCWSCQMSWCEKSFIGVKVRNGIPSVDTISEENLWFLDVTSDFTNTYQYGFYPGKFDTLKETVWNFQYRLNNIMGYYLYSFFDSYYVQRNESNFGYSGGMQEQSDLLWETTLPSASGQTDLYYNTGILSALISSNDLNETIRKLADSLTDTIRTGSNATTVEGQNLVSKTFIHVRWAWLALPLALMAIACVLLLAVAIKSHSERVAVWKDDPLALLFHRVDNVTVLPGSDSKTGPMNLNNLADEVCVRLDQDTPFTFVRSAEKVGKRKKI